MVEFLHNGAELCSNTNRLKFTDPDGVGYVWVLDAMEESYPRVSLCTDREGRNR